MTFWEQLSAIKVKTPWWKPFVNQFFDSSFFGFVSVWWYTYPSEKPLKSVGIMTFPTEWTNKTCMVKYVWKISSQTYPSIVDLHPTTVEVRPCRVWSGSACWAALQCARALVLGPERKDDGAMVKFHGHPSHNDVYWWVNDHSPIKAIHPAFDHGTYLC
jgi:hypothetical protein